MRLGLGVAVGVALALGWATPANAQSSFSELPYLTFDPQVLSTSTDANWSGAKRIIPYPYGKPPPLNGGAGRDYIWSRRCGRPRQRRVFSQKILVPGPPSSGRFLFRYAPSQGGRPYEGATLTVNGVRIARLPKTTGKRRGRSGIRSGKISARALRAFRYGESKLEIVVTKSRLKRGQRCQSRKAARNVGVLADVELDFRSAWRVSPPKVTPDIQRNVVDGQAVGVVGNIAVVNTGPSASLLGDLYVRVFGDGQAVIGQTAGLPGPPFHDCRITTMENIGGDRIRSDMHCRAGDFPAGTTAAFPLIVAVRVNTANFSFPQTGNGAGRVYVQVEAVPRGGEGSTGGLQTKEIILCRPRSIDPACAQ